MKKTPQPKPAISRGAPVLPELIVTISVALVALGLVAVQLAPESKPDKMTLPMLDERVAMLRKITDPIKRDSLCIPLSAYGRALDRALDKDARVFFSGLIGKTNGGKLGYYYFLVNHLFPREVALSLGTNTVIHNEYVEGVDCDSPSVLQSNGFDLMIRYEASGIQLVPLTQKGVPHE